MIFSTMFLPTLILLPLSRSVCFSLAPKCRQYPIPKTGLSYVKQGAKSTIGGHPFPALADSRRQEAARGDRPAIVRMAEGGNQVPAEQFAAGSHPPPRHRNSESINIDISNIHHQNNWLWIILTCQCVFCIQYT